jgi:hypothetical protein
MDTSFDNLSKMMIANLRQFLEIFNVKKRRRMTNAMRFIPYHGITDRVVQKKMAHLQDLLEGGVHDILRYECEELIQYLIQGADYYHNYYQLPILIAMTIGIVAWIVYIATYNVPVRSDQTSAHFVKFIQLFLFVPTYLNALFVLQGIPCTHFTVNSHIHFCSSRSPFHVLFVFPFPNLHDTSPCHSLRLHTGGSQTYKNLRR